MIGTVAEPHGFERLVCRFMALAARDDDLQLALWPADAIRAVLPPEWTLRETATTRELVRDGRAWLSVDGGIDGRMRLDNRAEGYRLEIESVASGEVQ